jgi:hypothetical protein
LIAWIGPDLSRPKGDTMNTKEAIRKSIESSRNVTTMFLGDLSDADLLVRPVPGANHIAWQIGHLISSEAEMIGKHVPSAKYPELPAGFADKHGQKNTTSDNAADFATKAVYLDLFNKAGQATLAALEKIPDADLDKPTGWEFAPTVGDIFLLVASHNLMHGGQFTVVRRKLGKPVLF